MQLVKSETDHATR